MEGQVLAITHPKPSIKISDESIFPSLHPLGPYYRSKHILLKRTSDKLDYPSQDIEPVKKLHISPNDGAKIQNIERVAYSSQKLKKSELLNWQPLNKTYQETKKPVTSSNKPINTWEALLGLCAKDEFQLNTMIVEFIAQRIGTLVQPQYQQKDLLLEWGFIKDPKSLETKKSTEASFCNDENQTIEANSSKKSQSGKLTNILGQESDQSPFKIPPLRERHENGVNYVKEGTLEKLLINEIDQEEKPKPIQTEYRSFDHEDSSQEKEVVEDKISSDIMPGYNDKIEASAKVGPNAQALLPPFSPKIEEQKRRIKLVWSPDEEKIEKVEVLMTKLKELLGTDVGNQGRVARLLKKNNFIIEQCLYKVRKNKKKFKRDLRSKKESNKKLY